MITIRVTLGVFCPLGHVDRPLPHIVYKLYVGAMTVTESDEYIDQAVIGETTYVTRAFFGGTNCLRDILKQRILRECENPEAAAFPCNESGFKV